MPRKRMLWWEYEDVSGLQRGQLWQRLTPCERQRLKELGFRPRRPLTQGVLDYLEEIFPLPDHLTELLSMTQYEKKCGFSKGELLTLLTAEQRERFMELGYRRGQRLTYRATVYLKNLGFY